MNSLTFYTGLPWISCSQAFLLASLPELNELKDDDQEAKTAFEHRLVAGLKAEDKMELTRQETSGERRR